MSLENQFDAYLGGAKLPERLSNAPDADTELERDFDQFIGVPSDNNVGPIKQPPKPTHVDDIRLSDDPFKDFALHAGAYFKAVGDALGVGEVEARNSLMWNQVAWGNKTTAQARHFADEKRANQLKHQNLDFYSQSVYPKDWTDIWGHIARGGLSAARNMSFMRDVTVRSITAAAAGGGTAAAVAGTVGTAVLPFAPEEAVTVPAAFTWGASTAGRLEAWRTSAEYATGEIMQTLVDTHKVPVDKARKYAIAGGAISGAFEVVQLSSILNFGKGTAANTLKTPAVQEAVKSYLSHYIDKIGKGAVIYGMGVAGQAKEEALQQLTNVTMYTMARAVEKGELPTSKDFVDGVVSILQAAEQGAEAGGVMLGGSAVLGKFAGEGGKHLRKAAGNPNVPQAVQMLSKIVLGEEVSVADPEAPDKRFTQAKERVIEANRTGTQQDVMEANEDLKLTKKQISAEKRTAALEQALEDAKAKLTDKSALDEDTITALEDTIKKTEKDLVKERTNQVKVEIQGEQVTAQRKLQGRIASTESHAELTDQISELSKEEANFDQQLAKFDAGKIPFDVLKTKRENFSGLRHEILNNRIMTHVVKELQQAQNKLGKDIKENQRILNKVVQKSGLDDKAKNKFAARIINTQTVDDLKNELDLDNPKSVLSTIQKEKERALGKKAEAVVTKQLSRIKHRRQGEKSKLADAAVQKSLSKLGEYNALTNPQLEAEISRLASERESFMAVNDDTGETDFSLQIANQLSNFRNGSAQDKVAFAASLKDLIAGQISERLLKKMENIERGQKLRATVVGALEKAGVTVNQDTSKERLDGRSDERKSRKGTFGFTQQSWEGKLDILGQHMALKELDAMIEAFNVDKEVTDAAYNKLVKKQKFVHMLAEHAGFKTLLGKPDTVRMTKLLANGTQAVKRKKLRKFAKRVLVRDDNGKIVRDKNGKADSVVEPGGDILTITGNEAITILSQMRDEDARLTLAETHGYTFKDDADLNGGLSTEEMLENALSREQVKLVDAHQKFWQEEFAELREHVIDETGFDLKDVKGYSGFLLRHFKRKISDDGLFDRNLMSGVKRPGSTYERGNSRDRLLRKDFYTSTLEQITEVEQWKAWRAKSKDLNYTFANADIKLLIQERYGDDFYTVLSNHIKHMTKGVVRHEQIDEKFITSAMNNTGLAFLGAKPEQVLKQSVGAVNLLVHMSVQDMLLGYTELLLHPAKNAKILKQSKGMYVRYTDFIGNMIGVSRELSAADVDMHIVRNLFLSPVFIGDFLNVGAAWGIYVREMNAGATQEQAFLKMERAIETTQSSKRVDQLSDWARGSDIKRAAVAFRQQPTRMAEFEVNAWRRVSSSLQDGRWTDAYAAAEYATKVSFINRLAQTAFTAVGATVGLLTTAAAGGSDKKIEEEAEIALREVLQAFRLGSAGGTFGAGDLITFLDTTAENLVWDKKRKVWNTKLIPVEVLNNLTLVVSRTVDMVAKGEYSMEELLGVAFAAARSVNLVGVPGTAIKGVGAPVEPGLRFLKKIEEDSKL